MRALSVVLTLLLGTIFTIPARAEELATSRVVRCWPLERYLVDVLGVNFDGTSPYLVVELANGTKGVFRSEEDEPWGSQAEVAGYRMSRWLGWRDLVPETVVRRLGRADLPPGFWPYDQESRLGSLQAFVPAHPATEAELTSVPEDRRAASEILTFVMGRYDNHSGNTLADDSGRVFLVDFENALEFQKVRYGEVPFVCKGQRNDDVPSARKSDPFPFDDAVVLHKPSLQQLEAHLSPFRAPWSGSTESFHRLVINSTDESLRSVVWNHRQWLQVKVRSRHPAHADVYPTELMARLKRLDLQILEEEILLAPFTREHALDILERRDQVIAAADRHNQR